MNEPSLVSFILLAYKQERFIREAVRSAFSQTYKPLEIILSDDCSPDRTFEIMREEAQAYRGPHQVVLNRTAVNSGLAENLNRAWDLAHGQLIVVQAGDDVSVSERADVLFRTWREPPQADCVFSDYAMIDASGQVIEQSHFGDQVPRYSSDLTEFVQSGFCSVAGCTAAYSATLNGTHGYLPQGLLAEDAVLSFRSLLGGGIRYVGQPLVHYRVHGGNTFTGKGLEFGTAARDETIKWNLNRVQVAAEWIRYWDARELPRDTRRELLVNMKREREYEYSLSKSRRFLIPFLTLKGAAQGVALPVACRLGKRYFLHA